MYVRLTGGRDRGHVKDFPIPDATVMLNLGQALPVDFDEPNALGYRELAEVTAPMPEPSAAEHPAIAARAQAKRRR